MGLLLSIGSVPVATCPAGGDRLPLASRIADPRNLTSGRALLGPDHASAYAGGGGNRSDGTPLVRRRSGALRYERSHVIPAGTAAPAARSALQHRALGHQAGLGVAPERDHVLDNVAQTAPDLVLILSREGLRPARRGAETTPAEPSSPPRSRRSAGQGGDDGPAACDEPAAQPGGGLRAAARWSGRSRGRVRASPAAPLASGPGAPEDAAEGGGV